LTIALVTIALVIGSVIFEPSPTDDASKSPDYDGSSSRDFYIPMSQKKTQQLTIAVFTMALCLAIPTVVRAADRPDPNLSTEPGQTLPRPDRQCHDRAMCDLGQQAPKSPSHKTLRLHDDQLPKSLLHQ
jgi:hypothetical protein